MSQTATEKILSSWPKWPQFGEEESLAVQRVIKSNQLFAAQEVASFEEEFKNYLGTNFAVGIGNATQGLHLALAAADIGIGDEVIVTSCSWISTASCILMQNAVPVFVDIEADSLGINPDSIENAINERTKAIIAVHILGYPSKIDEVRRIADKFNLILIEDASHAPGAELNGKKMGTFGDISVFSLQQRKAISTGDGGIACTNNQNFALSLKRLRSFGDERLSYNYRMTEFSAALGKIGLKKLDDDNRQRTLLAHYLNNIFKNHEIVKIRLCKNDELGVYYAVAIELNLPNSSSIQILKDFVNLGVSIRKLFDPLYKHPHFQENHQETRGFPWKHPNYYGLVGKAPFREMNLPTTEHYCNGRILELYVHPGTTTSHLDAFADYLSIRAKKK